MSAISLPPPKLPPRIHFFKTAISLSLRADSRGKAQIPSLRALAQDKAWQSIFTLESTLLYIYKHYIFFTHPLQTSANKA